jgi:hypothetical protein
MSDQNVAVKVREKLNANLLPSVDPIKSFVGHWDGGDCAACDAPILSHQTGCQIEMADGTRFALHLGCHALLVAERHR